MRKKLRFDCYILVFFAAYVLLYGQSVNVEKLSDKQSSGKSSYGIIGVTAVEDNIKQLNKALESLPEGQARQNPRIRRDPFVPLMPVVTRSVDTGQEEKVAIPEFDVSGIIFDSKAPTAIIGNEVKGEGEFIGEYQVYKIMEDKVLIKYKDEVFPVDIKK